MLALIKHISYEDYIHNDYKYIANFMYSVPRMLATATGCHHG